MPGEVIAGRYRLLEPLGRGAMSSVWLAEDPELDRPVALKTLAPTADPARFEREARAVAALSHPNICALYDYGESDGKPFMVLEYLPGGSLEDRLAPGTPLPDAETQRIATQVAAGLAHAHERGLVHRDLKPANVLFDAESRAKIADFGIARMGDTGTLTEAGTVLGTAAYISPEQADGLPASPASDVYSFGVLLFRMLTGSLPFVADDAMELVRMNRDEPPPRVASVRAEAPRHLAWTADAALSKDPARRPADGAALLAALQGDDTAATLVSAAPDTAATQVIRRPPRRRWSRILLPALLVALVLLGGGAALALVLTDSGGSGVSSGSLGLSTVPTVSSTAPTAPTTATTHATATVPTTTHHTTTTTPPPTTTALTTTHPATTTVPAPTTTAPPPPTTTAPATTTTTAATT